MTSVVERVRKLVALAASPNENEARNAAALACRLIREHGLELVDARPPPRAPPPAAEPNFWAEHRAKVERDMREAAERIRRREEEERARRAEPRRYGGAATPGCYVEINGERIDVRDVEYEFMRAVAGAATRTAEHPDDFFNGECGTCRGLGARLDGAKCGDCRGSGFRKGRRTATR